MITFAFQNVALFVLPLRIYRKIRQIRHINYDLEIQQQQ